MEKRVKNKFVVLFCFFIIHFSNGIIIAQDIHFSQYFASPQALNPALTGQFEGDFRVISNFRSQWSSISPNDYQTIAAAFDGTMHKEQFYSGLSFINDHTGDSKMTTNIIQGSIASKIKINDKNSVVLGLQPGFVQKSISIDNLTWDKQYDGSSFNSTLPTGEILFPSNFNYFDISSGTYWKSELKPNVKLNLGIAAFHLNRPKQSFYKEDEKLYVRWAFHSDVEIKLKNNISLNPSFMYYKQGPSQELNLGIMLNHEIGKKSSPSILTIGTFTRVKDALILYFGYIHKKSFSFGISYDINTSGLHTASNYRGGLELSFTYLWIKKNKSKQ